MSRLFLAFFLALSLHLLLSVLPWPQGKPPIMQPADNRSITVNLSQASAVVKKSSPPQMMTPTPIIPGSAVPVVKPVQQIPQKKTPERLQSRTKKRVMSQKAAAPPTPSAVATTTPTRAAAAPPAAQATTKERPQARPEVTPGPSPSIIKARPLYDQNPKPVYPALARRRGWQGVVILAVMVLADGSPGQLAIHTSSGHELLDKTALQTVKDWHFLPGTKNNIAAPMEVLVPVRFVLQ
ncbi:energy transducer TonB [Desulfocastanea catecholica]